MRKFISFIFALFLIVSAAAAGFTSGTSNENKVFCLPSGSVTPSPAAPEETANLNNLL